MEFRSKNEELSRMKNEKEDIIHQQGKKIRELEEELERNSV